LVAFQRAQTQHAQALTEITVTAKRHWNYPEKWIQIWLPSLTISPQYIKENETWMAVADERFVAYYSLKQDGESLWLDNLWVLPDFMGQGIGKQLFQHALARCRARGGSILKIESDPNAQAFYEKLGACKMDEHHSTVDGQLRILPIMVVNLQERITTLYFGDTLK
jgi:GNAT superfamily N-acetyltransferase